MSGATQGRQALASEGRYYEATWLSTGDASRVAQPLDQDRAFVHRLARPGILEDVPELTWAWQSAAHPPGDIVVAVGGIRVVSPVVREIFDDHRTPTDQIQWLPGTVIDPSGERLPHWIPHFPVHYDLIDADHSTFGPSGLPIRYSLSLRMLAGHAVTAIAGSHFTYVLSQPVVDALRAANTRGIMIMTASVS